MTKTKLAFLSLLVIGCLNPLLSLAQTAPDPANLPQRDGSHDFDFLIGNWKAHVRRLPDRLTNSNVWVEYDGISNHKKLLDSNANFEEFDVTNTDKKLHIKAQTLRLYNPASHGPKRLRCHSRCPVKLHVHSNRTFDRVPKTFLQKMRFGEADQRKTRHQLVTENRPL